MEFVKKYRYYCLALLLVFGGVFYFYQQRNISSSVEEIVPFAEEITPKNIEKDTKDTEKKIEVIENVIVDVKGAVKNPGVYELKKDSRVEVAIKAAGGVVGKGDITKVNLAEKLTDEMVVYVPVIGENMEIHSVATSSEEKKSSVVNLNKATETDLQTLPGIGPAKATAIITYRTEHGDFKTVEELGEVSGFGDKTVERLKPLVTVK